MMQRKQQQNSNQNIPLSLTLSLEGRGNHSHPVPTNKVRILTAIAALFTILLPLFAAADLPSDKTAKLYIVSDAAELNKLTGVSVFTGHVKIDHGSTHVTADKLTTYSDTNNQLIKAIAEGENGQLATYQTMTDPNKPPLNAKALVIQYFPQKHYVILIGQAYASQGKDSIEGPRLEYDMTNQLLITKNVAGTSGGRTQIVIQPDDLGH